VRSVVGSLALVGEDKWPADGMAKALGARSRNGTRRALSGQLDF
jgi:tRNA U38,U39,U40 pseudouridine synthase TruA